MSAGDFFRTFLVAVVTQAIVDLTRLWWRQNPCSTQITSALGAHTERQVAGTCSTVHGFAGCRQSEALFSRFMCFHFWHIGDSKIATLAGVAVLKVLVFAGGSFYRKSSSLSVVISTGKGFDAFAQIPHFNARGQSRNRLCSSILAIYELPRD